MQLFAENRSTLETLTDRSLILSVEIQQKENNESVLVVNFKSAQMADEAIRKGMQWRSRHYKCLKFNQWSDMRQCIRCNAYGHLATICAGTRRCFRCAGEHRSNGCKATQLHCANCGGMHNAAHPDCPRRKAERQRLTDLVAESGRFWANDDHPLLDGTPSTSQFPHVHHERQCQLAREAPSGPSKKRPHHPAHVGQEEGRKRVKR